MDQLTLYALLDSSQTFVLLLLVYVYLLQRRKIKEYDRRIALLEKQMMDRATHSN